MPAPHEASFAGPESRDAAEALARDPGSLNPSSVLVAIMIVGLLLTGLATWAASRIDQSTEERLLDVQTRQAATVLSTAISGIQQPMYTTLDALALVPSEDQRRVFSQLFGGEVGPDSLYVSASLWRSDGEVISRVSSLGVPPGLTEGSADAREFLDRALTTEGVVVRRVVVGEQTRIAYAVARPDNGWIIYVERAIPANRRAPVDRDSAFAELHYAIYLGETTDTDQLTTTDVDPADLPLDGLTSQTTVPFGDTTLTLVTAPRKHLGSQLSLWLPVALLFGGLALTLVAALVALKLVRSRSRAEHDTRTITTLYERVDSLFGEQRELFVRLQRALLPQANPNIPGIEFGAEYVAGAVGIDIGGDWYSVIGTGEGTFAFVVGDVSGNGVDAVAEMARARFTLRAYLLEGHSPATALEMCSRQFDVTVDGHIVTAVVGIGDQRTGDVTVAVAGHPLPLLASPSGAEFVQLPIGRPLGAGTSSYEQATFTMPPGSTLLCYTDGLVERRGEHIDAGMDRLARAVMSAVEEPLDELIASVIGSMQAEGTPDDIAVMALRRGDRTTRLEADGATPAAARTFVRQQLESRGVASDALVDDVVLATSELVTNSVRAGASHVDIRLHLGDGRLELDVEDDAEGWPEMKSPPKDAPGGRGLSIVHQLAHSLDITRTTDGKRVTVTWLLADAARVPTP
ncbi:MAG TPA: SpoIIE family protein phosphatase [Nocardioidaceae bacterium]|nr:SpoIIE family protein phosphatase [Nocardioidaceae bacterium]